MGPRKRPILTASELQQPACVTTSYIVVHPMRLHTPGSLSLQAKFTVDVGNAAGHPHGRVSRTLVTHPGSRQVLQAVPVLVSVGQAACGAHGRVTAWVIVDVRSTTLSVVRVTIRVTSSVTVTSWTEMITEVVVSVTL